MNIHYRILKVDPAAHGVLVRYFTDKVTEMDLANSLNPDGSIILNADGYPISTRTDVMISIYDTPAPSNEEIHKRIMMSSPVRWLKLQEDIKDPDIDTKMSEVRNLTGDSKTFTTEELDNLKSADIDIRNWESREQRAYDTIVNLMDSLKILASKDPQIIVALSEVVNDMKKIIEE